MPKCFEERKWVGRAAIWNGSSRTRLSRESCDGPNGVFWVSLNGARTFEVGIKMVLQQFAWLHNVLFEGYHAGRG